MVHSQSSSQGSGSRLSNFIPSKTVEESTPELVQVVKIITKISRVGGSMLVSSLVPRVLCGKSAWYTLFTHALGFLGTYSAILKLRSIFVYLLKGCTAHCRIILLVRHIWAVLKSETISL